MSRAVEPMKIKIRILPALFIILALLTAATALNYVRGNTGTRASVMFAGDILLDRGVGKAIQKNGLAYPYEKIKPYLQGADIAAANLECPVTCKGAPVLKDRNLIFRAGIANAAALKDAGFDLLNLANNHIMDYGSAGLTETLDTLQKAGISTVGAGADCEKAREPVFIEKNGIKFGFLGYTTFPAEGYFYFPDRPDTAKLIEDGLASEIAAARRNCDILVVSFHWGREFDHFPGNEQVKIAHAAIDNGADLVIGHHPHVLQGVEKYKDRLIFYSLGNFVFDRQIPEGTDETVLLNIRASDKGVESAELIPVEIKDCQPVSADNEKGRGILQRIGLYSENMGCVIQIKGNRGFLISEPEHASG